MIHLQDLTLGYGRRPVLEYLTLLADLLDPGAGSVRVAGLVPTRDPVALYRRLLLVPEEFALPAVTLDRFVRRTAPFYPDFSAETFADNGRRLEVARDRRLDTLSMAQRKKGYLAFALACNLPLLLLDEPTNGLDIPARSTLRSLPAAYAASDRTVIVSTHAARDIESLIDRAVILDERRLVLDERVERLTACFGFGDPEGRGGVIHTEPRLGGTAAVGSPERPTKGVSTSNCSTTPPGRLRASSPVH